MLLYLSMRLSVRNIERGKVPRLCKVRKGHWYKTARSYLDNGCLEYHVIFAESVDLSIDCFEDMLLLTNLCCILVFIP